VWKHLHEKESGKKDILFRIATNGYAAEERSRSIELLLLTSPLRPGILSS
jgi:hypothetical protein